VWPSSVLESNSETVGFSEGLGFKIDFLADHDVWGNISPNCDCRYGLSAGHNYTIDLQHLTLAGLVLMWP
jgi:hypothetical protein